MSFFLVSSWADRTEVGTVVGKDKFEDSRMGFGQMVALWLWVPTLTEYFTLWYTGVENLDKGLSGRVLAGTRCVTEEDWNGKGTARRSRRSRRRSRRLSRPDTSMTAEDRMQEISGKIPKTYIAEGEV